MFPSLAKGWEKIGLFGKIIVIILAASTTVGAAIINYLSPALKRGLCVIVSIPVLCDNKSLEDEVEDFKI
jgi:hypothetical protein